MKISLKLLSKNYKINGIDEFRKIGNKILKREENIKDNKNLNQKILFCNPHPGLCC